MPVVADSDDEDKEKTFNTNLTESEMAAIQEKRAQEAMRRSMDVRDFGSVEEAEKLRKAEQAKWGGKSQ